MKTTIAHLGTILLFTTTAGAARADVTTTAGATSIRAVVGVEQIDAANFGVELSRQLRPSIALDGTLSMVTYADDSGVLLGVLPRFTAGDRHRFTAGLGPSLLVAQNFGAVGFLTADAGYEFRSPSGISFVLALGPTLALNDSGPASCARDRGGWAYCLLKRDRYNAGDVALRARVGVGASF